MTTGDDFSSEWGAGVNLASAFETRTEHEMATAPRTTTGHLFHYTNTAAAVTGILATGTLRLSPYKLTNDLWESQPHYPVLTAHADQGDLDDSFHLWDEIDRQLRLHTKVGCLTQDVTLPSSVFNPDALRGWAHLSLWAHYGAGHTGVCLRFDRKKLVRSLLRHAGPAAFAFHGPVHYLSSQDTAPTRGIDVGQVAEFGADAVALAYAEANKDLLFFRKHIDWDSEAEYRLIMLNQSTEFDYIDIRSALTGVVLGSAFPQKDVPDLLEALRPYPGVSVEHLRYLNRRLHCVPFEGFVPPSRPPAGQAWPGPRREGSLAERLLALRGAETEATARHQTAEVLIQAPLAQLEAGTAQLVSQIEQWPGTDVSRHSRITAVPDHLRARSPGVPGEVIHCERGFLCVVENLPLLSHTLAASAAIQVLANKRLRLHAVVDTEQWLPDGNKREEHWRGQQEIDAADAHAAVASLLDELAAAVQRTRTAFDDARGISPVQ
ncbi:DUF2971 domain-containing protein [Streptomyces longwoodensis]|uniref:DUF2971 domain-containing protein n=1 Tax=Streptomyces longwoodensis TaxID=68231 RepID=UPI002E8156C6|nr:DUF2971 domain-containing protein [Streptomyces longwoodensis]WUC55729.1 DUF2971 domain-containing protein [Streptomyces longwoodensis]WUC62152.1 DUF2971 domain-containing protein [Streptomyces longwoodensis]